MIESGKSLPAFLISSKYIFTGSPGARSPLRASMFTPGIRRITSSNVNLQLRQLEQKTPTVDANTPLSRYTLAHECACVHANIHAYVYVAGMTDSSCVHAYVHTCVYARMRDLEQRRMPRANAYSRITIVRADMHTAYVHVHVCGGAW